MRSLLGIALSLVFAASASAQDCYRQRQVLQIVQPPVYQLQLGSQVQSLNQVYGLRVQQQVQQPVVLQLKNQRVGLLQRMLQPRLQFRASHGSQLRLSNGQRLRIKRGGLFGLRQRIVID